MTNEEASKIIYKEWQNFLEHNIDYAGISEAYKLAIKALQHPQCQYLDRDGDGFCWTDEKCKHQKGENEEYCGLSQDRAVSLNAVIDTIRNLPLYDKTTLDEADKIHNAILTIIDGIKQLPPVLSETDLIELGDRFGDGVEYVVRDMLSGKGERWKEGETD